MDRKQYLEMCCECSKLPREVKNIPAHVPDNLIINHNGMRFYPVQYVLSYENGRTKHYAILHDLKADSVTQVDLEKL